MNIVSYVCRTNYILVSVKPNQAHIDSYLSHIKVNISIKTRTDPAAITDILPQTGSNKTMIEVKFCHTNSHPWATPYPTPRIVYTLHGNL